MAEDLLAKERAFLDASVAVWREIDRCHAEGPYRGIEVTEHGVELRRLEREAWNRYRDALDATSQTAVHGESFQPMPDPYRPQADS